MCGDEGSGGNSGKLFLVVVMVVVTVLATITANQMSHNNTHHRHMQTLSAYNRHPTQTPTLTFMHSHNYSHNTISLALP